MGERWPFGRSKGRFNGTSRQLLRRWLYMLNKRLHLWICVSLPLMQHGNHWLVVKPSQDNTYYIYIYMHAIILKSYLFGQTLVFQWFVSHGQFNHQIRWDSQLLSNHSLANFNVTSTPVKINMTMEKPTVWRCTRICYQKWWFSS